ncbi:MAG: NAD(P)H-dependent glycerol-3-phosphate dehydrogenase [Saprospiraceae bacterium]|nr:NAD(P)H-dependent glycerol-3-phosphate dehydrogenase [Saprospiraceae bacterium]
MLAQRQEKSVWETVVTIKNYILETTHLEKVRRPVGIIGSGSFGIAIAKLINPNTEVLVYTRKSETADAINNTHRHYNTDLGLNIRATLDPAEICDKCRLIFPVVPSAAFRTTMQTFSPFLKPYHILIHGTKGFDLVGIKEEDLDRHSVVMRSNLRTMSEVIADETAVVRIGCLSGPNLASELIAGQPTATLIASRFDEVVDAGQAVLNSKRFHVFGSREILGAEFAGALKNIVAIGSGILGGKGLGRNIQAMLITRGLTEMILFGKRLGTSNQAFLGTAGIGDLIATATSTNSRNYTFGMRLAKGETREEIITSMKEVAEGVRTLRIAHRVARSYRLHVPITDMMYRVVFDGFSIERALEYLIEYPYDIDVDFI